MIGSWWPEFDQFLFTLAGALVGGSLVAWLSGYYSEKGKRKLLNEEFPRLLEQARQTSYETEKGKNAATKEDIQQVVEQIRVVTTETESIKAAFSQGVWHGQRLWMERRDGYVEALNTADKLRRVLIAVATSVENNLYDRATEYLTMANELTGQLDRSFNQLHVMGCAGHLEAFLEYTAAADTTKMSRWPEIVAWAYGQNKALNELRMRLLVAAKKELRTDQIEC
jgi:hypothetical protein